jgi:hypothetical protein
MLYADGNVSRNAIVRNSAKSAIDWKPKIILTSLGASKLKGLIRIANIG